MKKIIIILSCSLILIIGISTWIVIAMTTPKSGTLYVNGSEITDESVKIYRNYAELPLTKVIETLGVEVEWFDDSTAEIICDEKKYILDLDEESLAEDGYDFNFIMPAPGSTTFRCTVLDKEIVLDDITVRIIINDMGKKISISTNRRKSIVYVTERED